MAQDLGDGWRAGDLSAGGLDAEQVRRYIEAAAKPLKLHGVLIARRGVLLAEHYFTAKDRPHGAWWAREVAFGPAALHDVRSIGKSIVGLLFGIAQAQGRIGAVSTSIREHFPQYTVTRSREHSLITLEHLLTMSSGLAWKEIGSTPDRRDTETRMHRARDPLRYVLSRPVISVPGSRFNYHSGATVLLAAVLEQAMGMPLEAYARQALFAPLGITDVIWKTDWRGRAMPGLGLRMRPRDLLKVGQMLLDGGRWQEQEIVPADWVRHLQQPYVATGDGMQYSYQWWVSATVGPNANPPWIGAFGKGGQRLFVMPERELVVVMTAGAYEQSGSRAPNELFRRIAAAAS